MNYVSIITVFLIGSFTIAAFLFQYEEFGSFSTWASSVNTTKIVTEGNSTFSNSTQGVGQDVSKVIIIPNPDSNPVTPTTTSNGSSTVVNDPLISNQARSDNQDNESTLESQDLIKDRQSANSDSSSQNKMQRGEYKVDDNGIHYYDINNCSLVKGSSGIGDLSECEDAEREIQQELNG